MSDSAVIDEVDDSNKNIELIPYSYAKKHNVLVEQSTPDSVTITSIETPKLVVLSEIKRRLNCHLILEIMEQSEFEEKLRVVYDKGGTQATQLMYDIGDSVSGCLVLVFLR